MDILGKLKKEIMKILLILISFLSFMIKLFLHMYLDAMHKKFKGIKPGNFLPFEYFLPYMEPVRRQYIVQKKICNVLYFIFIADMIAIMIARQFIS